MREVNLKEDAVCCWSRSFGVEQLTECRTTLSHFCATILSYLSLIPCGCHNAVESMKDFLINSHGFNEVEMLVLKVDGSAYSPTKVNIEDAMQRISQYSQDGDAVFEHYCGHGYGRDSVFPIDFKGCGQILNDDSTYQLSTEQNISVSFLNLALSRSLSLRF